MPSPAYTEAERLLTHEAPSCLLVLAGLFLLTSPRWSVRAAGICGTDFHILDGRHPEAAPPLVPGHEICGEVVEIGKKVPGNALNKRVVADSYIGCGKCR